MSDLVKILVVSAIMLWLMIIGVYLGCIIREAIKDRKTIKAVTKNANKDYTPLNIYKKEGEIKMKDDLGIQKRISELLKNGWSYNKIAKEVGVSKTTISRWHKGETKPQLFEHYQAINSLYFGLYQAKEDLVNKPIETKKCKSWDEFEKEFFTDEYYNNAIAYHQKVIDDLKKSREAQKWKFTEDEKMILRKLPRKYKYIARDAQKELKVFMEKPFKTASLFGSKYWSNYGISEDFSVFNHKFKCIQWSDEQPCEFRKFI